VFLSFSRLRIAILAALIAGTAAAMWIVTVKPQYEDVAALRSQLSSLEREVSSEQAQAAALPQLRRDLLRLEASVKEVGTPNPASDDLAAVVEAFHAISASSRLEIAKFKPRSVLVRPDHTERSIEWTVEGTYQDLCKFFDRLSQIPQLITVGDLEIKPQTSGNGRGTLLASFVETMVETGK